MDTTGRGYRGIGLELTLPLDEMFWLLLLPKVRNVKAERES